MKIKYYTEHIPGKQTSKFYFRSTITQIVVRMCTNTHVMDTRPFFDLAFNNDLGPRLVLLMPLFYCLVSGAHDCS